MQFNKINYTHPLQNLVERVNRTPQETTVTAKWVTVPTIGDMSDTDGSIMLHYDYGFPAYSDVPLPSDTVHKLVSVTNHLELMQNKAAALTYLRFFPLSTRSSGGAGLTANEMNKIIENSLGTVNNAYNQGRIRLTAIPSHSPNWFRPKFVINQNRDYFNLDSSSNLNPAVPSSIFQPELAEGLSLPYEENSTEKALAVYESIENIEVWAGCYLAINKNYSEVVNTVTQVMPLPGGIDPNVGLNPYVFQRIPMVCEARFIIFD